MCIRIKYKPEWNWIEITVGEYQQFQGYLEDVPQNLQKYVLAADPNEAVRLGYTRETIKIKLKEII